ncbi:hypothetical protein ACFFKC_10060 [Pseudoduganella danionis]|uniref:PilZ domain-containing protein n=1 Tax=Pseudoduganella danionis TaxID=1890295 RepID=A0ABW9SLW6_9BURK|nr:hypothetical protein [Pseudoduganella danionis]MTW32631.1 hypothetical protein [Pseudoduganella danionis]
MGLFSRRKATGTELSGLGSSMIALPCEAGSVVPAGCTLVLGSADGQTRRVAAAKVVLGQGERAWCFHAGPYTLDLQPFAAAPEWGLRLRVLVDAADPRVSQQRFDLFLQSEVAQPLSGAALCSALQGAVQSALALGTLELPPCTTVEEWHAFRAGLNQLMYTRYGLTVDDCVPVDLAPQADYAAMLRNRALAPVAAPVPLIIAPPVPQPQAGAVAYVAQDDAAGLRRLFIELPALCSALRLLELPAGVSSFEAHQAVLLRLGMATLNASSMPSLGWATPDQPLPVLQQQRRIAHTLLAVQALDQAWAVLARMQLARSSEWLALLDETARICANLETGLAGRRQPYPPVEEAA